jgi:hypothetical protein
MGTNFLCLPLHSTTEENRHQKNKQKKETANLPFPFCFVTI